MLSSTKKLLEESKRQTRRTTYAIKKFVSAKPTKKPAVKRVAPGKREKLPNGIERVKLEGPRGRTYDAYKKAIEKQLKKEGIPKKGVSYAFEFFGNKSRIVEISLERLFDWFLAYQSVEDSEDDAALRKEQIANLEVFIMPRRLATKWMPNTVSKKRTRKRTAKKVSKKTRRKK